MCITAKKAYTICTPNSNPTSETAVPPTHFLKLYNFFYLIRSGMDVAAVGRYLTGFYPTTYFGVSGIRSAVAVGTAGQPQDLEHESASSTMTPEQFHLSEPQTKQPEQQSEQLLRQLVQQQQLQHLQEQKDQIQQIHQQLEPQQGIPSQPQQLFDQQLLSRRGYDVQSFGGSSTMPVHSETPQQLEEWDQQQPKNPQHQPQQQQQQEHQKRLQQQQSQHPAQQFNQTSIHAAATAADWTTSQLLNLAASSSAPTVPLPQPARQQYQLHQQQYQYQQQQHQQQQHQQQQHHHHSRPQSAENSRTSSPTFAQYQQPQQQQLAHEQLIQLQLQYHQNLQGQATTNSIIQQQQQQHPFDVSEYVLSRFETQKQRRASGTTGGGIGFLALAAEAEVERRRQLLMLSDGCGGGGGANDEFLAGGKEAFAGNGNDRGVSESVDGGDRSSVEKEEEIVDTESLEYLLDTMKGEEDVAAGGDGDL
ncbi:UNVERIFIED_CONTAM: hypothetical protein HDU68_010762 [Siphonaria sp. JEL0065]|nr:hypothetical protein HDU68_010762 [Siphonaria sp. JEL0065]